MMKILMVCLGNICRSPLAEGIMKEKIKNHNLDWEVDSAGTSSHHAGELPDPRSIKAAKDKGLDITDQRSRPFRGYDLETFDLIFAMDTSNYNDIMRHAQNEDEKSKVKMIMNEVTPGENVSIPDPYYGEFGYANVYEMLDKACDKIIENYKTS